MRGGLLASALVALACCAQALSLSPAQAVPAAPAAVTSSEDRLRAAVAKASERVAAATQAWEQGQVRLGMQLQRKVQLERELEALDLQARTASSTLSAFAGQLYRNPVDHVLRAALAGQPRLATDLMYLERRTNATASAVEDAGRVLSTQAQRVTELLAAQERNASAVTQLLKGQESALDAVMRDLAASEAALARQVALLRAQQAAASARGASCSAPLPPGAVNGFLPVASLCPVRSAPGHRLSMAAARAFDAMSEAYRAETGASICVTDSYRDFPSQVDLFRRKPSLAATPGRSNHGWGVAVDLCGGIQQFGSPAHEWMRANAPRFGWVHPAWAHSDGSRPEPWHWEYGGA